MPRPAPLSYKVLALALKVWSGIGVKLYAIRQEPLAEDRKQALKTWISKPEMEILMAVIAARARVAEQESIDLAHRAIDSADTPERVAMIGASIMRSQRYYDALKLLVEVQSNPDTWHTVKL